MPNYIRARMTLDAGVVQTKLDSLPQTETLFLLGTNIELTGGSLRVSQGRLVIVADTLSGSGVIDASGQPGTTGASGPLAEPGGEGGPATHGGEVHVYALHSTANITFTTAGGAGGIGGTGGRGRPGRNARPGRPGNFPGNPDGTVGGVTATAGKAGAAGGTGGKGGDGGILRAISTVSPPWQLVVSAGPGGAGGPGGPGGAHGVGDGLDEDERRVAPSGQAGAPGKPGADGQLTVSFNISIDEYWSQVRAALGDLLGEWQAHRLTVAEYYARAYTPTVRDEYPGLALAELDACDRIAVDPRAVLLRERMASNVNALGLPRDLDITPDFDHYIQSFSRFATLTSSVFEIAQAQLLTAATTEQVRAVLRNQALDLNRTAADYEDDLEIQKLETKATLDQSLSLRSKLNDVEQKLRQARDDAAEVKVGDVIAVVGAVVGAVAGVIAAVPTGGASVVGAVAGVVAISKTVIDNLGTIGQALFAEKSELRDSIIREGEKVGADVKKIKAGVEAVINLIDVIQALSKAKKDEKSIALAQQGLQLAHELMLANRRHQLSVQREASTHSKIERARSLAFVIGLNGTLYNGDSTRLRDSAMLLIQSVQAELDRVLMSLFYAQRSLKTYTLQEVPIFLDVGYVHPDLDRDFVEGLISEAVIGAEYAKSWANIVRPVELQLRYDNYFSQTQLNTDFLKLSVVDRVALDRLRDEHVLELVIDPVTDMNPEHFNTKIVQVFAALVGARSRAGVASLEVEHGAIYSQYTVTETPPLHVQTLTPRTITLLASHTPLQRSELTLPLGPSDFQVSPLFGRGVGGRWSLRITDFEFTQGGLDLSALTEVQVWIAYQFVND